MTVHLPFSRRTQRDLLFFSKCHSCVCVRGWVLSFTSEATRCFKLSLSSRVTQQREGVTRSLGNLALHWRLRILKLSLHLKETPPCSPNLTLCNAPPLITCPENTDAVSSSQLWTRRSSSHVSCVWNLGDATAACQTPRHYEDSL